jgi:hypothetical protein
VTQGGWRPSKQSIEKTMKELEGKVSKQAVMVMMGMDNGMFYEESEDGGRALPRETRRVCTTWQADWKWGQPSTPRG